jgi:hypothetical protein
VDPRRMLEIQSRAPEIYRLLRLRPCLWPEIGATPSFSPAWVHEAKLRGLWHCQNPSAAPISARHGHRQMDIG